MPSVNFYTMFEHYLEIDQWQITYNNRTINFNYSSSKEISRDKLYELKSKIENRINDSGFVYSINRVSKFIKKNEGKIPSIVNLNN